MKTNDILDRGYSYVFSIPLESETLVNLTKLRSIVKMLADKFNFSGRVEIYTDESYYNFSGDSADNIRLLRIGVALSIKAPIKRQQMLDYFHEYLKTNFLGIPPAMELSEASTVGTTRASLTLYGQENFLEGVSTNHLKSD